MTRLLLCAAGMLLLIRAAAGPAAAAFSATTANGTNSLRADTLAPPTLLTVNQACVVDPMPTRRPEPGGSSFTSGTSSGTLTIARPDGAQVGDVLIASIAWRSGNAITDASGGWTPIYSPQLSSSSVSQSVYYRVVNASEPTSYTWTSSLHQSAGGIVAYSGVDTVTPVNDKSGQANATMTAPPVTTTRANVRLVGLWAVEGERTLTVPNGMTQI